MASPTVDRVLSWRPDELPAAESRLARSADEWCGTAEQVARLMADLDAEVWSGESGDAARASGGQLVRGLRDAAGAIEHAASTVRSVVPALTAAGRLLRRAQDLAEAHGLSLASDGRVAPPPYPRELLLLPLVEPVERAEAERGYRAAVDAACTAEAMAAEGLAAAEDADRKTAAALDRARFDPQLVTRAGRGLFVAVAALLPTEIVMAELRGYAGMDLDHLGRLLTVVRESGVPPAAYADALSHYWAGRALERAGINPAAWDPSKGSDANRGIVEAVYEYYGQLYLDFPHLQWAGMANMIGRSFAAGFFDLDALRDFARRAEMVLRHTPFTVERALMAELAKLSESELAFYETTFLTMQQKIFFDQGAMHEAYLSGGMDAIEEMHAAGFIDPRTLHGWRDMDAGRRSGDSARLAAGNEALLWREQRVIIYDYYRDMQVRPSGPAFTWAMTFVGSPSVPGARGYPEVFPYTAEWSTPGARDIELRIPFTDVGTSFDNPLQGAALVETPFPDGNIANFEDRWNLIEEDTLPAYRALIENDPARATEIISSPVDARIEEYRLHKRLDEILAQLGNWSVEFEQ